jgi:hypothetical protein
VPRLIACAAAGVKYFGWGKLLSLVTFFAAAKKVTAAPHRGNANRPTRQRDPATNLKSTLAPPNDIRLIDCNEADHAPAIRDHVDMSAS